MKAFHGKRDSLSHAQESSDRFEFSEKNVHLSCEQSIAIRRIFQGAFSNILRCSEAPRFEITMKDEVSEFVLTISNKGKAT
jgi:signal transduction histidine kinase